MQVGHALAVYLHRLHLAVFGDKILCKHTHAWAYLEHWNVGTGIHRVGDAARYAEVGQEMLTEILFRSYTFHVANLHIFFHISAVRGKENCNKDRYLAIN